MESLTPIKPPAADKSKWFHSYFVSLLFWYPFAEGVTVHIFWYCFDVLCTYTVRVYSKVQLEKRNVIKMPCTLYWIDRIGRYVNGDWRGRIVKLGQYLPKTKIIDERTGKWSLMDVCVPVNGSIFHENFYGLELWNWAINSSVAKNFPHSFVEFQICLLPN